MLDIVYLYDSRTGLAVARFPFGLTRAGRGGCQACLCPRVVFARFRGSIENAKRINLLPPAIGDINHLRVGGRRPPILTFR